MKRSQNKQQRVYAVLCQVSLPLRRLATLLQITVPQCEQAVSKLRKRGLARYDDQAREWMAVDPSLPYPEVDYRAAGRIGGLTSQGNRRSKPCS